MRTRDDRLPVLGERQRASAHHPKKGRGVAMRPESERQRESAGDEPPPRPGRLDHRGGQQQREPEPEVRRVEASLPHEIRRERPLLVEQYPARWVIADPGADEKSDNGEPVIFASGDGKRKTAQQHDQLDVQPPNQHPLRQRGIIAPSHQLPAAPPDEDARTKEASQNDGPRAHILGIP